MADERQDIKEQSAEAEPVHPLLPPTTDPNSAWRNPLEGIPVPRKKIIVLVSGGGTNLQALIDAEHRDQLGGGRITCVISSRPDAYALVRAKENGIPTRILQRKAFPSAEAYSAAMLEAFYEEYADLIVQAGFMTILDASICRAYPNKMMNVHPALIPSFCGKGYYGLHVHEAVLEKGVKVTGATVHFVNEVCDGGPIILQKAVSVQPDDTPETLQRRVMEEAEWQLLPRAVRLFCQDRISVKNGRVLIAKPSLRADGTSGI